MNHFSAIEYGEAVTKYLIELSNFIDMNKFLWITMHPHGETAFLYGPNAKERRNSYVLNLYSIVSIEICKRMHVHYVDIFSISDVVHDLSYDSAHFKAPVENEIAALVLHALADMRQLIS